MALDDFLKKSTGTVAPKQAVKSDAQKQACKKTVTKSLPKTLPTSLPPPALKSANYYDNIEASFLDPTDEPTCGNETWEWIYEQEDAADATEGYESDGNVTYDDDSTATSLSRCDVIQGEPEVSSPGSTPGDVDAFSWARSEKRKRQKTKIPAALMLPLEDDSWIL